MEILIIGIFFAIGLITGSLLVVNYKENIYFNSCVYKSEGPNFLPEFMIMEIEKSEDIDGKPIAKYTVRNYFFSKKNNKGFKYQTFYFYDKIDKYVIGQKLRLE